MLQNSCFKEIAEAKSNTVEIRIMKFYFEFHVNVDIDSVIYRFCLVL